jgi:hypothetical protein
MHANLAQLQQQEEEAGKLRTKISSKVELLREQARELEAMHSHKKLLEEQVRLQMCVNAGFVCTG